MAEALELRLLGPVAALRAGEPLPLGAPRQRLVLAVLAVNAGRLVPAERLLTQIWGEHVPGSGTGPLRTYVSQLRRALAGPGATAEVVRRRPPGYVLEVAPEQVDASRFEAALAEARAAASLHDWGRCLARLDDALALWRGPAFADLALEPAVAAEAARLDRLRADARALQVDALLAQGRSDEAVACARPLLEHDPLDEHLWAQVMLALYRSGRQSEALRCYAHARSVLVEQLGVEPGPELRDREQAILGHDPDLAWRPARPAETTPRRAAPAPDADEGRGDLPHASTSFVGRVAEQRAALDALRSSRLVVLTGTGGAGKTRLALAVAGALQDELEGGAWFTDLLPVSDAGLVARAVATPLGADSEEGDQVELLRRRIGGRRVLVVLDNCEHHLEPVAALVEELLRACPELRILATSREQLRVPGEHVLGVPPLSLPRAVGRADDADVGASDAVALFVARARAVVGDFEPRGETLDAVVAICRRLDGLPLAIELAAGLVGSLPVSAIAERLDDRFALLSDGRRTTVPRQRTLQAALDDSFDLLDPAAQQLFVRLGVFVGDFTLPAAEAVAGDAVPPAELARHLARLVAASMVSAVQGPGGTSSYRLLDTVRRYACARLEAGRTAEEAHRRHAHYYARFAEEAERNVHGPDTPVWLDRIATERPNLRTALEWLFAHGELETALTMSGCLQWFFGRLGALDESVRWLSAGLEHGDAVAAPVRAKVLSALCAIRWLQGEFVETRDLGEQAVALAREVGDDRSLATALIARGHAAVYEADYGRADECFGEAELLCERTGDRWALGWALSGRAIALRREERLAESRRAIEAALAIFHELRDDHGRILLFLNLALISQHEGAIDEAESYCELALELAVRVSDRQCEHAATCMLGVTALGRHDDAEAREHFVRALTAYPGAEHRLMRVMALEGLATLAAGVGAHREAALTLGRAGRMRRDWHLPLTAERRLERRHLLAAVERHLGAEPLDDLLARGADLDVQVVTDLAIGATAGLADDHVVDLRRPVPEGEPAGVEAVPRRAGEGPYITITEKRPLP